MRVLQERGERASLRRETPKAASAGLARVATVTPFPSARIFRSRESESENPERVREWETVGVWEFVKSKLATVRRDACV